jgi:integrase
MSRGKRQRRQATVVKGPRSFPHREEQLDSSILSGNRRGTSFAEELGTGLTDFRSSQSPYLASSHFPSYNAAIQDSRMTFALFVETKFIPEHVEFKTRAGKIHYQAILKHLITPELVKRIFNPGGIVHTRLKCVPEWPYLDGVSLCNLGADHVRRLINAANAAGYSSQTVKHIKNVFFAIISHAQREGYFNGANPASLVKLPKIVRRAQHNLTFEQAKAVLQHLKYPAKEIALFAITTGMSLVEICDLRWKHVNLTDSERFVDGEPIPPLTLAVRNSLNRDSLGSSRSVSRNRIIEIREPLFSTFRELIRRNSSPQGDSPVLVSNKKGPILPSNIRISYLKQVGKSLGLPWLSWQVLRRARSSFVGEFLSQLNFPSTLSYTGISAPGSEASAVSLGQWISDNARKPDASQSRRFCAGRRFRRP